MLLNRSSCISRQRNSFTLLSVLPFKEALAITMSPKESSGLDPGVDAAVNTDVFRWFCLAGGLFFENKSGFFIKKPACRLP